jgi:ribosome recycling factor
MINDIIQEARNKMKATAACWRRTCTACAATGPAPRSSTGWKSKYYGQTTELRQIANISTPEAMQILIRPYDASAIKAIEKAIQSRTWALTPTWTASRSG